MHIDLHRNILIKILRDIYSDSDLRTCLGFKGGTAAMLFYDLPRFSVDLDFDLLNQNKKTVVFNKLTSILSEYGSLSESIEKVNTLFWVVTYQKGERNLKVEVSKRSDGLSAYKPQNYLGISMLVMNESGMAAGKLSALLSRNKIAARDLFDLWFFLKNDWKIDETIVVTKTNLKLMPAIHEAQNIVKNIKKSELLSGLGDLLDVTQRNWVRDKLTDELLFLLRLYEESLSKDTRVK